MSVDSAVYTKYYFDLREIAEEGSLALNLDALSLEGASKLMAFSAKVVKRTPLMRPAKSLDATTFTSRAILN